ncbi:MAG: LptF/LptG family permease [Flavobacteriaceae bacterium]
MKILDRYILITYLKTFVSVFVILMFIFVLQTIWLYISELAGKDLDVWVILKFLWYVSPRLIPLVLPLTILVTSLMVFGGFSERYEFAAMKSTGISLQRAMRSLMFFIGILALVAFFFANNVIPYSEYKWQNLRRNIAQLSPSMAIVEGQFCSIGDDFNIKVAQKSGDRDEFLKDVVIHKKNPMSPSENTTVIVAEEGELTSAENSNTLSLILRRGNYYEDVQLKNTVEERVKKPFAKSYFETYTINIDLTAINNTDIDKENNLNNQNMYKISELVPEIHRISEAYSKNIEQYTSNMYFRTGITQFADSTYTNTTKDTVAVSSVLDLFDKQQQNLILNTAVDNVRSTIQSLEGKKNDYQIRTKTLNKHEIALHEKYVLAIACIILFFVGAPLGAIIRKGGIGLPLVVAIVLFLTYHFIGIFAKNSAEDGTMHPFIASWLSTAIMFPLGIWLTYRATTDQGIFDTDAFLQRFRFLKLKKAPIPSLADSGIILTQQEKALVMSRTVPQLKEIVKNFKQYDYSEDVRKAAMRELANKGYSDTELKLEGTFENTRYNSAEIDYNLYLKNSKKGLLFYISNIILLLVQVVFKVLHFSEFAIILVGLLSFVSIILFYVYAIKSLSNQVSFYSVLQKKKDVGIWLIVLFLGLFIYVLIRYSEKRKMKEELSMIR